MKTYKPSSPVPVEVLHETLRFVESSVIAELNNAGHAWSPIGTRVAYFLADETGMPAGNEYRHELGYLDPLDEAPVVEVSEGEYYALLEAESDMDPLPIAFVDGLQQTVRQKLQASANRPLVVGVAGVLSGSISCWGVGCWCTGRKGYYRACRLVCTGTGC